MRIIEQARGRGCGRLQRLWHEDGEPRFHTGAPLPHRHHDWEAFADHAGMRVTRADNVVVEAAFRPSGTVFVDRDTGWAYEVCQSSLFAVVAALVDGALRIEGDCVAGLFTFRQHSGKVFLAPAAAPGKAAAPAAAPDLSEFVKALGK